MNKVRNIKSWQVYLKMVLYCLHKYILVLLGEQSGCKPKVQDVVYYKVINSTPKVCILENSDMHGVS